MMRLIGATRYVPCLTARLPPSALHLRGGEWKDLWMRMRIGLMDKWKSENGSILYINIQSC